jgi:hypothetical protein
VAKADTIALDKQTLIDIGGGAGNQPTFCLGFKNVSTGSFQFHVQKPIIIRRCAMLSGTFPVNTFISLTGRTTWPSNDLAGWGGEVIAYFNTSGVFILDTYFRTKPPDVITVSTDQLITLILVCENWDVTK